MLSDGRVHQRGLVDRRIVFQDSERAVRYVFPFVDRRWRVPFVVVDFPEGRPMVLEGPFRPNRSQFRTPKRIADLRPIESVALEEFDALVHYDPWWVFRGLSGVKRTWAEALLATNLAHPFRHEGRSFKIRDLAYSSDLDRLEEITARGPMFRLLSFHPGEVDLLTLRPAPKGEMRRRTGPTAKAL